MPRTNKGLASFAFLVITFLQTQILQAAVAITWPPIGGTSYSVPQTGETGWSNLTNYLVALQNAQGTTSQKITSRIATSSPVTVVSATDAIIVVDLSVPGATLVNLPAGVTGQYFAVVDGKGDAATNNITVDPNSTQTINGASTYVINKDRAAIVFAFDGVQWIIHSEFNAFSSGGSVLINPMSNPGEMIYGGASGVPTALAAGVSGQILQSGGAGAPSWITTLGANHGGTGNASYTAGDLLYASGSTTLTKLAAGTSGQVLQTGTTPSWVGTLLMADGTAANPSHSFVNGTSTGGYLSASNEYSIATSGTQRLKITTSSLTSTVPVRVSDGSTSGPTYSFASDSDTGIYRKGSGNVGFVGDGSEIASYGPLGQWTFGLTGSSNAALTYRFYVPTAASTTPSSVITSPYLEFTSQGSNGVPGLLGNNNTTSADSGLMFIGATKDGNTAGDMRFDVRENDNSAYGTTTNTAFRWSTFGTTLATMLRNGTMAFDTDVLVADAVNNTVGIGTASPSTNAKLVVVSSGSITAPSTSGNEALFVDTGASGGGITILTANDKTGSVYFGDPDDTDIGGVQYDHSTNQLALRTSNSSRFTVSSAGAINAPNIHNVGSGNITSGTYTPSVTPGTNVSNLSGASGQYQRVGDIVYVTIYIAGVQCTAAANTASDFTISLPIASNLGTGTDVSGVGVRASASLTGFSGAIVTGFASADTAFVDFNSAQTTSSIMQLTFSYRVI